MATDLVARLYLQSEGFDKSVEAAKKSVDNFKKSTEQAGKQVKTMQGQIDVSIPGFDKFKSSMSSILGGVGKFAGVFGVAVGALEVFQTAVNSNAKLQEEYNSTMDAGKETVNRFFSAIYSGDWSFFNDGILQAIKNTKDLAKEYSNTLKVLQVAASEYERVDAEKNYLESIIEDENRSIEERKAAQAKLDKMLIIGIADINEAARATEADLRKELAQYGITDIENAQKLIQNLYNPISSKRRDLEKYRELKSTAGFSIFNTPEDIKKQKEARQTLLDEYTAQERDAYDGLLRLVDALTKEEYLRLQELFDKRSDLVDKAGTWDKDRTGARDEIQSAQTAAVQIAVSEATKTGVEEGFKKVDVKALEAPMIPALTSLTKDVTNKRVAADIQSGYIDVKGVDTAIKTNESYAESLSGVASILGSITNLTKEGAGAWLSYAANVMTAAAQAIPSIKALASAQALQATTGAAASTSSIPIVGWLTAGAAVASVIAAIASTPKFAYGGIVPGSSFTGDNVPALVNSGEMILNRGQQANLFRMIAGGGGRAGNVNVSGEFTVRGRDLVAVISNQERVNSRVR